MVVPGATARGAVGRDERRENPETSQSLALKDAHRFAQKAAEKRIIMPRRSTPEPFALQVGARIRELRQERGMSLGALADASALSKGHLSSVEHGLAAITIHTISRLAEGFEVPPMYLLTFAKEDERAATAELIRNMPQAQVRRLRKQIQAQVGSRR